MLAYAFVVLAIVFRLVIPHLQPHPWDFTPVGASLLFFGAYGSKRQLWIPVALFAATDVYLNLMVYHYPFGMPPLFGLERDCTTKPGRFQRSVWR
jgi:hypothetical protein